MHIIKKRQGGEGRGDFYFYCLKQRTLCNSPIRKKTIKILDLRFRLHLLTVFKSTTAC